MIIPGQFGFNCPSCPKMIIGRSSTKFRFFYTDQKSKMAGNRLTLDAMGKCSNASSETTNMIKAKLNILTRKFERKIIL
jgi:hypothetical protein